MDQAQNEPFLPVLGQLDPEAQSHPRRPIKKITLLTTSFFFLLALVALTLNGDGKIPRSPSPYDVAPPAVMSRGTAEGVSEKVFQPIGAGERYKAYPWTNDMLMWQRTGYHFQPQMNWMNDPNGYGHNVFT